MENPWGNEFQEVTSCSASDLEPQIAVPMHGYEHQHDAFRQLVQGKMPGTTVVIPKRNTPQKVAIR